MKETGGKDFVLGCFLDARYNQLHTYNVYKPTYIFRNFKII